LSIYEAYAYVLRLFNIHPIDYYLHNHFVILHLQKNNQAVNYETLRLYKDLNKTRRPAGSGELVTTASSNYINITCILESNSHIASCLRNDDSNNPNVNMFYFHFYNFCLNFWKRNF
jgi:hypothetical protein